MCAAAITDGRMFRAVNRSGSVWGVGITEKVVWHIVKHYAKLAGILKLKLTTVAAPARAYVMLPAARSSKFSFCSVICRWKQLNAISGANNVYTRL